MADVAVILGAGPGLGAALARRFAEGGFDIALIARSGDKLAVLADEIAAGTGRAVRGFSADATDPGEVGAAIGRIAAEMGAPAVLIHNASRWIGASATELDPGLLASELALGPVAALAASQAVLPGMEARGGGTILWTGSRMGLAPEEAGGPAPALAAAKTALRGLALASAAAFRERGVTFATVTINGGIKEGTGFDPAAIAAAFWQVHAAGPGGTPAEVVFEGTKAG